MDPLNGTEGQKCGSCLFCGEHAIKPPPPSHPPLRRTELTGQAIEKTKPRKVIHLLTPLAKSVRRLNQLNVAEKAVVGCKSWAGPGG
jgi:hypothetical protein